MPNTQKAPARLLPAAFCAAIAVFSLASCADGSQAVNFELSGARRGTIERTVMSSGTIHPVATVRVLPLMSGSVERIFVDYNDAVRRGDVLAELNTDMLRLRREQMQASVQRAQANFDLQELNYRNQLALFERDLISEFELLTSRTTLNNLRADLAVAQANLSVTDTEINQHAFIVSPIDGIVLARNINIGDTVTDNNNANSTPLFLLAENLQEMQIEATVSELDVASIYRGQAVRFTLESMPGRIFAGRVESLRLVPTVVSGVVAYTVIIRIENHDGSLLPGMTCLVEFIVERSEDAVMVPNAALRYQPTTLSQEQIAEKVFFASIEGLDPAARAQAIATREQALAQASSQSGGGGNAVAALLGGNAGMARGVTGGGTAVRRMTGGPQAGGNSSIVMRNLWYLNGDGSLGVMQVRVGISDGNFTEILGGDDIEGRQFISRERI